MKIVPSFSFSLDKASLNVMCLPLVKVGAMLVGKSSLISLHISSTKSLSSFPSL